MHTYPLTLPNKPLKFKKAGLLSVGQILLLIPISLLVGGALLWWCTRMIKDVQTDQRIAENAIIIEDARVSGECKSKMLILVNCDVIITRNNKPLKKSLYFLDLSSGDYNTDVIAPRDNPENLTLSLAAEKANNRYGAIALLAIIGLFFLAAGIIALIVRLPPRERAALADLNRPENQPWRLVELDITLNKKGHPKEYTIDINGSRKKMPYPFKNKQEPWVVNVSGNTATLLAFAPKNGGNAIPIDQQLTYISGLSKQEKAQLADDIRRALLVSQVS